MKKRVIIIAGSLLIFILILSVIFYLLYFMPKTCNDGTFYNECSKTRPYFCVKGNLIEKASVCGCNKVLKIEEDKCTSVFQTESKNITLNYVLRGRKENINLVVYGGLYNYLSELPRDINSYLNPTLLDFKLRALNEEQQRELLLPLVIKIESLTRDKTDQARIAVSLVQNIPFGKSNKTIQIGNINTDYQRYPYEVLYDMQGICSEKSELMIFLLREIGYGTASLYYTLENHEAVGIKCPSKKSNTDEYCFVETTGPSIITDDQTEYFGIVRELTSLPEIINLSDGFSLDNYLYEYQDAKILINIREHMKKYGTINPVQYLQFKNIKRKYGLINFNEYSF